MALAETVKSPCCKAKVAWSYYKRVGFDRRRVHRFCQKCGKHYVKRSPGKREFKQLTFLAEE